MSKSKDFLSTDEIRKIAPSVFSETPSDRVSKHYTHIPTSRVVSDMEALGWGVVDVQEVAARQDIGTQKHLVVFRNDDIIINGDDGDDVYPQILLTNSHDGKNCFTFTAGLFRMICANGLVIATATFENVKMRHMGYTFEDLQIQLNEMVERLPLVVESINSMKEVELGQEQTLEFAERALGTRFTEAELGNIKIDLEDLVAPTRTADKANDLWTVFNVVQEKIITGNFEYEAGGKTRKARKIKNFNQDMKINKEMFELANEYAI